MKNYFIVTYVDSDNSVTYTPIETEKNFGESGFTDAIKAFFQKTDIIIAIDRVSRELFQVMENNLS